MNSAGSSSIDSDDFKVEEPLNALKTLNQQPAKHAQRLEWSSPGGEAAKTARPRRWRAPSVLPSAAASTPGPAASAAVTVKAETLTPQAEKPATTANNRGDKNKKNTNTKNGGSKVSKKPVTVSAKGKRGGLLKGGKNHGKKKDAKSKKKEVKKVKKEEPLPEGVYEVEAIKDINVKKDKSEKSGLTVEYLIKWVGYDDPADLTWEPETNVMLNTNEIMLEFWKLSPEWLRVRPGVKDYEIVLKRHQMFLYFLTMLRGMSTGIKGVQRVFTYRWLHRRLSLVIGFRRRAELYKQSAGRFILQVDRVPDRQLPPFTYTERMVDGTNGALVAAIRSKAWPKRVTCGKECACKKPDQSELAKGRVQCVCAQQPLDGDVDTTDSFTYGRDGRLLPFLRHQRLGLAECTPRCGCGGQCAVSVVGRSGPGQLPPVAVYHTRHTGWGVRALAHIPAGTFIGPVAGQIITFTPDTLPQLPEATLKEELLLPLHTGTGPELPDLMLDMTNCSNFARFVNHSCQPNAMLKPIMQTAGEALPTLALFATTDIAKGKQITRDYGFLAYKAHSARQQRRAYRRAYNAQRHNGRVDWTPPLPWVAALQCRCNSRRCRGMLTVKQLRVYPTVCLSAAFWKAPGLFKRSAKIIQEEHVAEQLRKQQAGTRGTGTERYISRVPGGKRRYKRLRALIARGQRVPRPTPPPVPRPKVLGRRLLRRCRCKPKARR